VHLLRNSVYAVSRGGIGLLCHRAGEASSTFWGFLENMLGFRNWATPTPHHALWRAPRWIGCPAHLPLLKLSTRYLGDIPGAW
jgi:hypothetical protein